MRSLNKTLKKQVASRIQAGDMELSASLWVSRPSIPLEENTFLEKQVVAQSGDISRASIAVCRPKVSEEATYIYLACITSGVVQVRRAPHRVSMESHKWELVEFSQWGEDVAICFDGDMIKTSSGRVEFITERIPWVFWVLNGSLYASKLDSSTEIVTLAESNCTAVSAVRAMKSASQDFGLVVFFITGGSIYYRQLIDGVWMDAELVTIETWLETPEPWLDIAAFRTWDYRIGIQVNTASGFALNLLTQYMGIGRTSAEHIEIRSAHSTSSLIGIQYHNPNPTEEHIEIVGAEITTPYGGLYSIDVPVMVSAHNEEDDDGNWGVRVVVEFSAHLKASTVSENSRSFSMSDENGLVYSAVSASLDTKTGVHVTLEFPDFNSFSGVCTLVYTPGTITSMADTTVEQTQTEFTPENLNPSLELPELVGMWNLDSGGTQVVAEFSEALIGDLAGNEDKFTFVTQEYDKVPGGTLSEKTKTVTGIKMYASVEECLDLTEATLDKTEVAGGILTLEVTELDL